MPFFSLRLGQGDQGNDPPSTTTRKGYDLIAKGFGVGYNSNLEAVIDGPEATDPAYLQTVGQALATHPERRPGQRAPDSAEQHGRARVVQVDRLAPGCEDLRPGQHAAHRRTCRRSTTERRTTSTSTATPRSRSTSRRCSRAKLPLFIAAVVGLSFLLLMIAFRSVVVPLTAAVMNLFAAGASFGIVVAIFQWGWGSEALGVGKGGPIEAWAPVMFFAILFGLSMDYQVFLVSRMHEEWVHTNDNARSITVGQAETGGIITAAAADHDRRLRRFRARRPAGDQAVRNRSGERGASSTRSCCAPSSCRPSCT